MVISGISRVRTSNPDDALGALRRIYGEASGEVLDTSFEWRADVASLGPVTIIQGTLNASTRLDLTPRRYMISMARERVFHVASNSRLVDVASGRTGAVISAGRSIVMTLDPGYVSRTLVIEPDFLEAQFHALTGENVQGGIQFEMELSMDKPGGAIVHQIAHYLASAIEDSERPLPAALVSSCCESLSRALLFSQPHNHAHIFERPAPPSSRAVVRLVEEYVETHAGGPIVATDLARITGVSMPSIEAAFRQHRGMTPMAFLRQCRLERVRRLLLDNPLLTNQRAAQTAGYLRVETFEAAYFKAFGEGPAQTRYRGSIGSASRLSFVPPPAAPDEQRLALLSARERAVCGLVAQGRLNKQIADELGLAEKTVEAHRARVMKKLGVDSVAELVRLWDRAAK